MKDVVAEVLEAQQAWERKRAEAISFLLERRRALVAEIDERLWRLGDDPETGSNEQPAVPTAKVRAKRRPRKCSNCGQPGHTARSCLAPTLASARGPGRPRLVKQAGRAENGGG